MHVIKIKCGVLLQAIDSDPAHAHGAGIVPAAQNLLDLLRRAVEPGTLCPDVAVVTRNCRG